MIDSIPTDNNVYIYESSNLPNKPETLKKLIVERSYLKDQSKIFIVFKIDNL